MGRLRRGHRQLLLRRWGKVIGLWTWGPPVYAMSTPAAPAGRARTPLQPRFNVDFRLMPFAIFGAKCLGPTSTTRAACTHIRARSYSLDSPAAADGIRPNISKLLRPKTRIPLLARADWAHLPVLYSVQRTTRSVGLIGRPRASYSATLCSFRGYPKPTGTHAHAALVLRHRHFLRHPALAAGFADQPASRRPVRHRRVHAFARTACTPSPTCTRWSSRTTPTS